MNAAGLHTKLVLEARMDRLENQLKNMNARLGVLEDDARSRAADGITELADGVHEKETVA